MDFSDIKYAYISPMAQKLFDVAGVDRVFYGKDFISVTKNEDVPWDELKPEIYQIITEHYTNKLPLFTDDFEGEDDTAVLSDDSEAI